LNRDKMLRNLLHLTWPVLIAQLALMANSVIDTVMAGRLSAVDLAAVGIGASIYIAIFVSVMGVLLALTPTVAHLYGAARHQEIGEELRQSAWVSLLLAAIVVVLLRNPEPLLALSQLTPAVEVKVRAYLDALSWGVLPALLFRIFYGFSTGIGKPRPVMVLNLIGVALKVPLNLLFMFGGLGLPGLGGPGCAVATALISLFTCVLAWAWCGRTEEYKQYRIFARFSPPSAARLWSLFKLGLPIGATFFVDVTAFTFMALFIARLGPAVSAAHQIAANLAALSFMLPLALGNAASVLAAQALGAGDLPRARHAGWTAIGVGVGVGTAVSLILAWAAPDIAGLYTSDAEVRLVASTLIAYVAVYHFVDALQVVAVNVLRGYKKTTLPMAIYVVALWGVGLGGGYLLAFSDTLAAPMGARGFWLAAILSVALAGSLVTVYFLRVSRHKEDLPPSPLPAEGGDYGSSLRDSTSTLRQARDGPSPGAPSTRP